MANLVAPDTATLDKLKKVLGPSGWKSPDDAARFYEDPRDRFTGQSALIALPDSTEQVVELVKICQAAKVGIVPYSGGTGVVAGQLSPDSDGLVILSLERMNKVRDVSLEDEILVAEAGCILSDIHRVAEDVGKYSLSARRLRIAARLAVILRPMLVAFRCYATVTHAIFASASKL